MLKWIKGLLGRNGNKQNQIILEQTEVKVEEVNENLIEEVKIVEPAAEIKEEIIETKKPVKKPINKKPVVKKEDNKITTKKNSKNSRK